MRAAIRKIPRGDRWLVGLGLLAVPVIVIGLMFFSGYWHNGSSYSVSAYVPNARGIAQNSTVFEAGLPVGHVKKVKRNGPNAILTLRIDKGPTPLPADSKIQVGLRSLAGEADVLLMPGRARKTIREGGSLGLSQAENYTEVDQILNVMAGSTRGKARNFIRGLGTGVAGQERNLNNTVGGFTSLVNESPPLTSTLAAQRGQVADIVQYFGDVMGAIGQRTEAMKQFSQGARSTFGTLAVRDRRLASMLRTFPPLLDSAQSAGTSIARNSPQLSATADQLGGTVRRLSPTFDLLRPGARSGVKIVNSLDGASPQLSSMLRNLTALRPEAVKTLPAVHGLLCEANPIARFISPYGDDFAAFFQNFGAALQTKSAQNGHPFIASVAEPISGALRGVQSPEQSQAIQTLLNMGVFSKAQGYFNYHVMQPPGHRNDTTFKRGFNSSTEFGAANKYPHVQADCAK